MKTMSKALIVAASLALVSGPLAAEGEREVKSEPRVSTRSTAAEMPSDSFRGQWWTASNGCEYSRTGRPGEVVWYLIVNTAHQGCVPYIKQRAFY